MNDDDLIPGDDIEPEDDGHQDDTDAEDNTDAEPPSAVSRTSVPSSGLNALNSYFGSDYFKSIAGFDELFKPGGAWNAMFGNATKGLVTPELLETFSRLNIGEGTTQRLLEEFGSIPFASISKNLAAGAALNYPSYRPSLTKGGTAYSPEMNSPADYFSPWEGVIGNFADLQVAVTTILNHHQGTTFLWRGQQNAEWPLHSSLFRAVWKAKGVRDPGRRHRSSEPFPTDQDLQKAETRILAAIREHWRFDDTSALSTFARLQHFGAPTRLLDVSRNPLIAAWFATEEHAEAEIEEADARIFALATTRVAATPEQRHRDFEASRIDLETAALFKPFWDVDGNADGIEDSGFGEWGTGRIRRFWIPPHYEARIAAQNAAFILDGVPVDSPDLEKYYPKGRGHTGSWRLADRLAASSISVRFSKPRPGAGSNIAKTMPPSYTFRITAEAKRQIRMELEDRYSYNKSTIYPDIQGAAQAIRNDPDIFKDL
ncbi:FRG domain-containing protein [Paenarthrobacter nitroguajacolicus]|uniref:FRG domain-containing protein n=1 Tax=Paenarthrobacter nitroguajacolicus TaxID=211146 RepID=A0A558GYJ1_PAENT|nr:FRG domain-containing protein [Paenarthrobacter nitroguajacolicus]TVU61953.1 FRG domain-containing protein [Paenarthrobacter nitroguajacolicus]